MPNRADRSRSRLSRTHRAAAPDSADRKDSDDSQLQRLPISRQLEVAAARHAFPLLGAHGAFPVDGAGARARVELLVLHERLDLQREGAGCDADRNRIFGSGPPRAPPPERLEADLSRLEAAHAAVGA